MAYKFNVPGDIDQAPGTFAAWAQTTNFLLKFARAFTAIEGKGGTKVTISESNVIVSSTGLPDGYGPEEFTICDSGTPVTRKFLTNSPD